MVESCGSQRKKLKKEKEFTITKGCRGKVEWVLKKGYWELNAFVFSCLGCKINFLKTKAVSMWWITLIDFRILKNPCIPGIKPTWSWCMISLVCCWILIAKILLRIFASVFISDIGLFSSIQFTQSCPTLHIRWPKYWSSSLSISPSSEHSGLVSFRMDWPVVLFFCGIFVRFWY